MLNPGGSVAVPFNKSAATRMNNNVTNGARATMPLNLMAQNALRNQYSKKNPGNPPVGTAQNTDPLLQGFEPTGQVPIPTGGPQLPAESVEDFDPGVFAEQQLDQIVDDIKTEQFLQSPRVKDAVEAVRFKNLMNSENPKYQPDPRSLFRQVAARIGASTNGTA